MIAAGVVTTVALQAFVPAEEVFWSGDGGLKNLMAKQFARGTMHVDLRLTEKEWVRELWSSGLHPGAVGNYMFDMDGKYFSVFPYPFPLFSAPFYALFGVRGYYILPVVSLWALWISMYLAMRRACLDAWKIALLMFAFIFAMPVTLYGATFWEHTPGLALAIIPVLYTLRYDDEEPGRIGPTLAGASLGLAVWFRPETLALIAVLIPAMFVWRKAALGIRGWFLFSSAAAGMIVLFFALNYFFYGYALGTHGIQMTSGEHSALGWGVLAERFARLARLTVHYAPVGGFMVFLLGALAATKRFAWRNESSYLFAVALLFFPLMVFMVPSDGGFQIGPRFAFIEFALIILICAFAWRTLPRSRALRAAAAIVLLLTVLLGMKRSALHETRWLAEAYRTRVLPAYTFIAERDESVLAVSRVEATLELGGLMDEKDFFAAFDDEKFARLLDGLRARNIDRFLFVAFGDRNTEQDSAIQHEAAKALRIEPLGRYGEHFYCYAVTIP